MYAAQTWSAWRLQLQGLPKPLKDFKIKTMEAGIVILLVVIALSLWDGLRRKRRTRSNDEPPSPSYRFNPKALDRPLRYPEQEQRDLNANHRKKVREKARDWDWKG
jgi:hypothetical protein